MQVESYFVAGSIRWEAARTCSGGLEHGATLRKNPNNVYDIKMRSCPPLFGAFIYERMVAAICFALFFPLVPLSRSLALTLTLALQVIYETQGAEEHHQSQKAIIASSVSKGNNYKFP